MTGRIITLDSCCNWLEFEQGTPEWAQARCGILTASKGMDMDCMLKSGKESAKRINLKKQLCSERFTGIPHYIPPTYAMRWGTETEPLARHTYAEFTGFYVEQVGLALSTEIEFFGASPDGMITAPGMPGRGTLEIKCPESSTFFQWVIEGVLPECHRPQMLAQMAGTGATWGEFCAFDPRYPAEQDLFIRRFVPHPQEIEDVKKAARQFLSEVAAMERMFLAAKMV
jgi:hypothetical protein